MTTVYVSHPIKNRTPAEILDAENNGSYWALMRDFKAILPRQIPPGCVQTGTDRCKPDGSAGQSADHTHACYMKGDLLTMLAAADMILLMPGWESSVGCRAELNTALAVGISVQIFNPLNFKESM